MLVTYKSTARREDLAPARKIKKTEMMPIGFAVALRRLSAFYIIVADHIILDITSLSSRAKKMDFI